MTLPLTWTTRVAALDARELGVGDRPRLDGGRVGSPGWRSLHSSAVTCGAIGREQQRTSRRPPRRATARLGALGASAPTSRPRCSSSISAGDGGVEAPLVEVVGDLARSCGARRGAAASSPVAPPSTTCRSWPWASRQSRSRNRAQPSITSSVWSVQSNVSAGGPTKRWKRRSASAPTVVEVLLGRDEVALGLGHLGAVQADHALGEQPREGLARECPGRARCRSSARM